ncbi:hypothetical protein DFH06DRAFT_1319868 [Mycena polygramma]|nr:hypothetical protein DFH06DRAFT_1319868 [Mycena polygramma]
MALMPQHLGHPRSVASSVTMPSALSRRPPHMPCLSLIGNRSPIGSLSVPPRLPFRRFLLGKHTPPSLIASRKPSAPRRGDTQALASSSAPTRRARHRLQPRLPPSSPVLDRYKTGSLTPRTPPAHNNHETRLDARHAAQLAIDQ